MAYVAMRRESAIILEVLVPTDVPADQQPAVEEAVVEFLLGPDQIRPELMAELSARGINTSAIAAAYAEPPLAVCPAVGDRQFIPGVALGKLAASSNISFTKGGSLHIDFLYDQAKKMKYPSDVLYVRLRVPHEIAGKMTDEITGEITTAIFGDCDLPPRVKDYLAAHGVDLNEMAKHNPKTRDGRLPPTTRVGELAARRLEKAGLNVNQFGNLKVLEVTAHK